MTDDDRENVIQIIMRALEESPDIECPVYLCEDRVGTSFRITVNGVEYSMVLQPPFSVLMERGAAD